MIVVDSNVVVYLVTGRDLAPQAQQLLRQDPNWVAPGILRSEVRNVMVGLVRRGFVNLSDALGMVEDADAVLGDAVFDVEATQVVTTAAESGLSAYDAEFVVLARALGVPLITADSQILECAGDVACSLDAI